MSFDKKLKELLEINNMKPTDLANKTGLSEASISYYLSGKKEPKGKNAINIANVLNVSLDELMESNFSNAPQTRDQVLLEKYHEAPDGIRESVDKLLDMPE